MCNVYLHQLMLSILFYLIILIIINLVVIFLILSILFINKAPRLKQFFSITHHIFLITHLKALFLMFFLKQYS